MKFPLSTGHAARLLDVSEPRLNALVRQGKVVPTPEVVAGRRLWHLEHVLQAADLLSVHGGQLHARLAELEVSRAS